MQDYVKQATRTESPYTKEVFERAQECIRLQHAVDGLTTEVGEMADVLKRYKYYGKEIDYVNVKEELGDLMWYIAIACAECNVTLEEVMEKNIAKLRARYPEKFTEHDAINRDLSKERATLEQK